jgi:phosphate transport system permease protein
MPRTNRGTLNTARIYDRLARWVVTLGGAVVIVSVLGILVLIVATTLPLFYAADARLLAEAGLPASLKAGDVLGLGIQAAADDSWLVANVVDRSGKFRFIDLRTSTEIVDDNAAKLAAAAGDKRRPPRTLQGATPCGPSCFTLRWSDGAVSLVKVAAKTQLAGKLLPVPKFSPETVATIPADKLGVPEQAVMYRTGDDAVRCAALYNGRKIIVTRQSEDLSGDKSETKIVLDPEIPGPVTAIAMSSDGKWLYAGTAGGSLLWWEMDDERPIDHDVVPPANEKSPITSLQLMLGDITLVAGDARGNVTNWFFVKSDAERPKKPAGGAAPGVPAGGARAGGMVREVKRLTCVRTLVPHRAGIGQIVPSPRNHAVLIGDADRQTSLDYTTNRRRLLAWDGIAATAFTDRGDVVAGLAGDRLKAWCVEGSLWGIFTDELHPEVNWDGLFGSVWYEGHSAPDFSWQPQGSKESEPKFSLVPLVFGTLKGTFYAMLLACPLALGGAAYVSHFTSPRVRAWVKPAIEMMAAVPSVVLGFLVGLWLAPLLSDWLLAFFLALVTVPLWFVIFLLLWQAVRKSPTAEKLVRGREFFITALWIAVGLGTAALLSGPMEQHLCGGDVAHWMAVRLGVVYDQRNSILIAFGVGFLVIPLIFSLSEDALSSVPHSMTAASMALGASRWQTLRRVVLPSASPGIFAAVMIGFGRAVGETMVFLMATGNTPVIDLSPFNGMRTLAANIAEEVPGAPVHGTLYRTLFLCAVILFVMTFFLNTIAEFVRQRLRKRYGQF